MLSALLGAWIAAIGCTPPASNALIYAQPEDPKTLDPINTDIAEAVHVITNICDTLVTYDDRHRPRPGPALGDERRRPDVDVSFAAGREIP
jgi:hypothetical protein